MWTDLIQGNAKPHQSYAVPTRSTATLFANGKPPRNTRKTCSATYEPLVVLWRRRPLVDNNTSCTTTQQRDAIAWSYLYFGYHYRLGFDDRRRGK